MRGDEDDPGVAVSRILARSLMVPPGIPEFATRSRLVEAGTMTIRGRAWSGFGAISGVEFSDDDGYTWHGAAVEAQSGPYAWQGWTYDWEAIPGIHVLVSKATDQTGYTQPIEPTWNLGGYQVNATQRVPVEVRDR
jgi:hypothetical protein